MRTFYSIRFMEECSWEAKEPAEEQYRLTMECRQSGLTDHQWCEEHDIKPSTFYNWVKKATSERLCGFTGVNRTQLSCSGKSGSCPNRFSGYWYTIVWTFIGYASNTCGKKQHFRGRANEAVCWKFSSNYPKWNRLEKNSSAMNSALPPPKGKW